MQGGVAESTEAVMVSEARATEMGKEEEAESGNIYLEAMFQEGKRVPGREQRGGLCGEGGRCTL